MYRQECHLHLHIISLLLRIRQTTEAKDVGGTLAVGWSHGRRRKAKAAGSCECDHPRCARPKVPAAQARPHTQMLLFHLLSHLCWSRRLLSRGIRSEIFWSRKDGRAFKCGTEFLIVKRTLQARDFMRGPSCACAWAPQLPLRVFYILSLLLASSSYFASSASPSFEDSRFRPSEEEGYSIKTDSVRRQGGGQQGLGFGQTSTWNQWNYVSVRHVSGAIAQELSGSVTESKNFTFSWGTTQSGSVKGGVGLEAQISASISKTISVSSSDTFTVNFKCDKRNGMRTNVGIRYSSTEYSGVYTNWEWFKFSRKDSEFHIRQRRIQAYDCDYTRGQK